MFAEVVLPDVGMDLAGLVEAGIFRIGTALSIIVGAYLFYLSVRVTMARWSESLGGNPPRMSASETKNAVDMNRRAMDSGNKDFVGPVY